MLVGLCIKTCCYPDRASLGDDGTLFVFIQATGRAVAARREPAGLLIEPAKVMMAHLLCSFRQSGRAIAPRREPAGLLIEPAKVMMAHSLCSFKQSGRAVAVRREPAGLLIEPA